MEIIDNTNGRVHQLLRDKQALEVMLALDMLEIFNDESAGLIHVIRDLVKSAIVEMNGWRQANQQKFDKLWNDDWRSYAGCKDNQIGNWDMDRITARVTSFRAEHCADWIRIYGEVIEKVVKGTLDWTRTSYQKGGREFWDKSKNGLRQRELSEDATRAKVHGPVTKSVHDKHATYAHSQTPSWELMQSMPSAGIHRWDIKMDSDMLGRLDQVFGLMPGATISGTTTDNIFFFDRFSKVRIDPIYYLLPTATIVGGGHHSMLEVALPLALNDICNYQVGLYTTLSPDRRHLPPGGPDGIREIKGLLEIYENHELNHLMLVFYRGARQPDGCFLFDNVNERKQWQEFATADESLMRRFRGIPAWPKKVNVKTLIRG